MKDSQRLADLKARRLKLLKALIAIDQQIAKIRGK